VYLYENNYSEDVVIAGVLHDILEDTSVTSEELREEFGGTVLKLVAASTKDNSIKDGLEKTNELIKRCVESGEDALIVKSADILDSFKWYSSQNNESEIAYCMRNANAIFEYKPEHFSDKIFNELKMWQNKYSALI
jgi:(p)ppGpp synthase/HD superfamily hydrolase